MSNCHPFQVVGCGSETRLQVADNLKLSEKKGHVGTVLYVFNLFSIQAKVIKYFMSDAPLNKSLKITEIKDIFRPLVYERVYLSLYEVVDTPFHIQRDDLSLHPERRGLILCDNIMYPAKGVIIVVHMEFFSVEFF